MAEGYSELANERVSAADGIGYAYRDTGGDGYPAASLAGPRSTCFQTYSRSYYVLASESGGEPPGRCWGPGAKALGFEYGQLVERGPL